MRPHGQGPDCEPRPRHHCTARSSDVKEINAPIGRLRCAEGAGEGKRGTPAPAGKLRSERGVNGPREVRTAECGMRSERTRKNAELGVRNSE